MRHGCSDCGNRGIAIPDGTFVPPESRYWRCGSCCTNGRIQPSGWIPKGAIEVGDGERIETRKEVEKGG